MAQNEKTPQRVTRRGLLKDAIGVAIVALMVEGPRALRAEGLPTELPPYIQYFPQAAETVNGDARFTVQMATGDILLIVGQTVEIAGNVWTVDPKNNPDKTMVIAVAAGNNIDELSYRTFPGVTVWKGREKTSRWWALDEDVDTAGKVQATRTFIPGNCTPNGCASTRLITAVAHKDADGVTRFDARLDQMVGR